MHCHWGRPRPVWLPDTIYLLGLLWLMNCYLGRYLMAYYHYRLWYNFNFEFTCAVIRIGGSHKMQRTFETPSYANLDNASTKEVLRKNSTDSYMGRFDIYHKYSSTAEQTVAPFGSRSPCFSLERYPVTPPSSKLKPPYLPSAYRHQSNLGLIVDCDDWPIDQLLINYTSDRDDRC